MSAEAIQDPAATSGEDSSERQLDEPTKRPALIKALDALNEVAPLVGGPSAAAELLVHQIYQGKVRAYALRQWRSRETDLPSLWKDPPPDVPKRRVQISPSLFRPTATLLDDLKDWKWRGGGFFVTVRKRPTTRHIMEKVRFAKAEIEALAKEYGAKTGRGGRPPKEDAWQQVWIQIVRMAVAGKLTKEFLGTRDAFRATVFEALGWKELKKDERPLAENTLSKVTGPIWDAIIEPKGP